MCKTAGDRDATGPLILPLLCDHISGGGAAPSGQQEVPGKGRLMTPAPDSTLSHGHQYEHLNPFASEHCFFSLVLRRITKEK